MSHCNLEAVTFCREHHTTLLSLPLHSSNKLQPLDRGFFGSREKIYAFEAGKWMHNHSGLEIQRNDICFIFRNATEKITVECVCVLV